MTAADREPLYDLAIVGGGINGVGIARDAAGRGARVLLLERGDLASGTSSASTKLIHGGLRYLEHGEIGLVREALHERERLWALAPHIIWPLRLILPHVPGLRPRWQLRLGLFAYDHLGGRKRLPATQGITLARHPAGAALKPELTHGFAFSDCWVEDARLVILNARDAAARGATIHNRTEVMSLARSQGHWRIETSAGPFAARALVNAAGPGVNALLDRAHLPPPLPIRQVRGSHIVVPRVAAHEFAYFFQLPDGRISFAIPYEQQFTLIGTTDRDQAADAPIAASAEEIAYLCDGASRFFRQPITPADVVWTYAGVRPLADDASGKPEAATRGYRFELDEGAGEAPILSVYGGKLTTYRTLAQGVMDALRPVLPMLGGRSWTSTEPLPGGDFPVDGKAALIADHAARYPFLDAAAVRRLTTAYGTEVPRLLGSAQSWADLGQHYGAGFTDAEMDWLKREEWAQSADDMLWRRSKLGLHLDAAAQAAVRLAAEA